MYTSDTAKKTSAFKRKGNHLITRPLALALVAGLCIGVDNIYAIFGHGVRSSSMSLMFLYPLGGALVYSVFGFMLTNYATGALGRLGVNTFNSGMATLTLGSFLVGILEIAGSSSAFIPLFFIVGCGFSVAGFLMLATAGIGGK